MRKLIALFVPLCFLLSVGIAAAGPGNNRNAQLIQATCENGLTADVVVTGAAGHTNVGIGIARSLYRRTPLDTEWRFVYKHPGRGFRTIWCEWTNEAEPGVLFGGDVQLAPPFVDLSDQGVIQKPLTYPPPSR